MTDNHFILRNSKINNSKNLNLKIPILITNHYLDLILIIYDYEQLMYQVYYSMQKQYSSSF